MSNKIIVLLAVFLLALASLLTGIPIGCREWTLIIAVTFLGPFMLGYLRKAPIFAVIMTAIYLPTGLNLPRYSQNSLPLKMEPADHMLAVSYLFLIGLVIGVVMTYAGRLLSNLVKRCNSRT